MDNDDSEIVEWLPVEPRDDILLDQYGNHDNLQDHYNRGRMWMERTAQADALQEELLAAGVSPDQVAAWRKEAGESIAQEYDAARDAGYW